MQGPESDYDRGETIAKYIYAPVMRSHRITVEQMAILEPTMAETCAISLIGALRECLDEAVTRGDSAMTELLLKHGAGIDTTDRYADTVLHVAAMAGDLPGRLPSFSTP